jgi:hypothetical protein
MGREEKRGSGLEDMVDRGRGLWIDVEIPILY